MKPVYKLLAMTVVSMTAVGAMAAPGNNPASVQYVQQYVNNAIANNPGPRGFTGVTGAVGAKGAIGATGFTGAVGAQGVTGAVGAVGAKGATGAQGAQGMTGAQGAVGFTGAQGAVGFTGATGFTGAAGANGAQGFTGSTGATGPLGIYAPLDLAQGGVVFWVDGSGQHGLVAALSNVGSSTANTSQWLADGVNTNTVAYAFGNGVGAGYQNTATMAAINSAVGSVSGSTVLTPVLELVTTYQGAANPDCGVNTFPPSQECYSGWYIPSPVEFNLMVAALCNQTISGYINIASGDYWTSYSSGQTDQATYATVTNSASGNCSVTEQPVTATTSMPVRPIRQF